MFLGSLSDYKVLYACEIIPRWGRYLNFISFVRRCFSLRIGIEINSVSYTPESYAYSEYLRSAGCIVQLADRNSLSHNNDINILYAGVYPFWKGSSSAVEVHEYQSLSVPPLARLKDFLKCTVNRKPDGRIFLNDTVRSHLYFPSNVPSIRRDMGVDLEFFDVKRSSMPAYDVLYCGSVAGRRGLLESIYSIAKLGFKVLVVGDVEKSTRLYLERVGVEFTGRLDRKQLFSIYGECRYGLNFTPNLYPFNIQTSTKTLEYLASGMGLISNRYKWSEEFCRTHAVDVLWLDDLLACSRDLDMREGFRLNREKYSWNSILDDSGFIHFLEMLLR